MCTSLMKRFKSSTCKTRPTVRFFRGFNHCKMGLSHCKMGRKAQCLALHAWNASRASEYACLIWSIQPPPMGSPSLSGGADTGNRSVPPPYGSIRSRYTTVALRILASRHGKAPHRSAVAIDVQLWLQLAHNGGLALQAAAEQQALRGDLPRTPPHQPPRLQGAPACRLPHVVLHLRMTDLQSLLTENMALFVGREGLHTQANLQGMDAKDDPTKPADLLFQSPNSDQEGAPST